VAQSAGVKLLRTELLRKTCPRCGRRTGNQAARCRRCGYRYPEKSSPKPAGLAMGAGFPLFVTGTLILLTAGISTTLFVLAGAMVFVGLLLFFDPR
jgi:ribosomal protein L40E